MTDLGFLAAQLDRAAVVPIIGAGGSCDCGIKLAWEVADEMYESFDKAPGFQEPASDLKENKTDLGTVADSIYLERNREHLAVVEALGLDDESCWPGMDGLPDHFCAYRVLARLVREDLFGEALTFNYDCGFERGLKDEGFLFSEGARGGRWRDHATVVTDAATNAEVLRRGAFTLNKAHGCAQRYRELAGDPNRADTDPKPEDGIIVRWGQLLDWRSDYWVRDLLADRARRNVLLLIGFGGQDAVIHVALSRVLQEVYGSSASGGDPRLVVIDKYPDKLALKMLVSEGYPNGKTPPGTIAKIGTDGTSVTAALLMLLTLLLTRRLRPHLLPAIGVEAKLAEFAIALPEMLRWSFLLRQREQTPAGMQRMNFERAAVAGYVPLTADPRLTASALDTRRRLREKLGFTGEETIAEALRLEGLVFDPRRGTAYVPVGLSSADLLSLTVAQIERACCRLNVPRHLEVVLVAWSGSELEGRVLRTGATVRI